MEGVITAIHGEVVEIEFSGGLPNINDALLVKRPVKTSIILEVHDHISHTTVKAIALGFTQGLKRGMIVTSSGGPFLIPACRDCLGRVFNIFGEPIDDGPPIEEFKLRPIHKTPPVLEDQVLASGILETGIKIIDLLSPFPRGGKIGLFGGAGVGKTVLLMEFIYKIAKNYSGHIYMVTPPSPFRTHCRNMYDRRRLQKKCSRFSEAECSIDGKNKKMDKLCYYFE